MASEKSKSDFIALADVPGILPRKVHPRTVARWADQGVAGVVLRSIDVAGELFTTGDWLTAFLVESTAAKRNRRRSKSAEAAE